MKTIECVVLLMAVNAPAAVAHSQSFGVEMSRVQDGLMWFCLLVLIVYFYFRRQQIRVGVGGDAELQRLNLVATLPLGRSKSLLVVRFAGEEFLIGSTDNALQLLSRVDLGSTSSAPPKGGAERSYLNECLERTSARPVAGLQGEH